MSDLTKSEKISLGKTEIAKRIRQQLKEEFKNCKFSVVKQSYSGGSSITIRLVKAGFKVVKDFSEIPEATLIEYADKDGRARTQIKEMQESGCHQLSTYTLRRDYNASEWCNGVFLTEEGHKLWRRVVKIADYYNFDESDMQTDYYSVNFSLELRIGEYDKPFIQTA